MEDLDSIIYEGRSLVVGGNPEDAVACFARAAEIDPKNAIVWNDLGVALFLSNQIQPAVEAFQNAIHYDAKFPDAYIKLATVASRAGDTTLLQPIVDAAKFRGITLEEE